MRRAARPLALLVPILIVAALGKAHAAWVADDPYDLTASSRFAWTVGFAVVLSLAAYGAGLPDAVRGWRRALTASLGAAAAAAAVVSGVQLLAGDALLPRFVVMGSALVCVPWWVACAGFAGVGRARAEDRDRVVLVADVAEADAVAADLAGAPERPASLVAVVSPEQVVATGEDPAPLERLVSSRGATLLVLDRTAVADESVVAQAARLHEHGVRVRTLSLFYERWFGKLPLWELERASLLFDIGEVHRPTYGRIKRMVDVAVGLVGLVALVVLVPVVAVGDLVANRGPLLYRQPRVGKGGVTFSILKFRTMRPGDGGSAWTASGDERVTPFGRVLRATHLDEVPQVVNILRGDLSLVGPRPEQPHYVEELVAKVPFYDLRHLVRPGLTGWAQVKFHYGADVDDAVQKLQYDFYYLRRQGPVFDLRIIGRTVRSVVRQEGR